MKYIKIKTLYLVEISTSKFHKKKTNTMSTYRYFNTNNENEIKTLNKMITLKNWFYIEIDILNE